MVRKKKSPLTKAQLDILYECWKEGDNTKERLVLIEQKLSNVPTVTALKIMRKLAKTDTKWLKWTTRQKNLKEKEKEEKIKEREKKKKELERRREERIKRKEERQRKEKRQQQKENISESIDIILSQLEDNFEVLFFFCPDTEQYVSNIACIHRIFSRDSSFGNYCDKCRRMDKYIPTLKEIIDDRPNVKKQGHKRHKTCEGRSKSCGKDKTKGKCQT